MAWDFSINLLPYVLSAAVAAVMVAILHRRRHLPGARPLLLVMAAACLWSAANALEVAAPTLERKFFWARLEYVFKVTIPVAWFVATLEFAGRGRGPRAVWLTLLCAVPAVTLILVWTTAAHGLVLDDIRLDASGKVMRIAKRYGPWFWVSLAYAYALIAAATFIVLTSLLRLPGQFRRQAPVWIAAALVPALWNLAYIAGIDLWRGLDLTPAAFTVTSVFLLWGFLRLNLLELIPAAREAVFESMAEGVLVVDPRGRLAEANPAAASILRLRLPDDLGRPLHELAPALEGGGPDEIELDVGSAKRSYEVRVSPLADRRARRLGTTILLLDVTENRRLQAELSRRSMTDELTGLYNRRGFFDLAERQLALAARHGRPLLLVYADLDGLKGVNDLQGHAAGDRLLMDAACALRAAFRDTDVVARLGGDEFAVVAIDADAHSAPALIERAAHAQGAGLRLSIGCVEFDPSAPRALTELLRQADADMYRHKRARAQPRMREGPGDA